MSLTLAYRLDYELYVERDTDRAIPFVGNLQVDLCVKTTEPIVKQSTLHGSQGTLSLILSDTWNLQISIFLHHLLGNRMCHKYTTNALRNYKNKKSNYELNIYTIFTCMVTNLIIVDHNISHMNNSTTMY